EEMTLEEAQTKLAPEMLPYFRAYLDLKSKFEQARQFEDAQKNLRSPFPDDVAVELIPQEGPQPIGTFLLECNGNALDSEMVYACESSEIIVETTTTVTFSVRTDELEIQKVYTFYPDRYEGRLDIHATYLTGEETADRGTLELVATRALGRYLEGASKGRKGVAGQAAIVQLNGKMKKMPQQGQKLGTVREYVGTVNWFGMENRYFIAALVPHNELELARTRTRDVQGTSDVSVALPIGRIAPGTPKHFGFHMFMGPKDTDLLAPLGAGVHNAVFSTGFLRALRLSWICPLILWLLKALYRVIPNYGVGILILSVLAKWVTYPLTIKQLRAMKKMQELSPQIQELREKYKDNPRELQKKTMELYSQHGANPMGSCLPMLLQMPVFIGLFMTLNYSIQLRGAPFALWIDDLSKPDALFYIPFSLPMFGFVSLNVIPLVMGLITYLQQSKQVVDPQQAFMTKFMPLFFMVLLWNFPSGVILYWTVSSLLQGVQQRVMDQPKHGG
ncbi:MAG TPA: YidC/Oxa1 family insertase periplasmic-domain containing protein, partial [bacterium]|nr:YidC/Oxa1 family insertase periplasmic-domain containing protein [bacterium]